MKVKHLKIGWSNENFEQTVELTMKEMEQKGFEYYDIKISSKDDNCLLIFKETNA